MRAEIESTRLEWEDSYRRLTEAERDPSLAQGLQLQLKVVREELRKRVGSTFTLDELASEYGRADRWVVDAMTEKTGVRGWPSTLSIVEGAAFFLHSRGAVDYEP